MTFTRGCRAALCVLAVSAGLASCATPAPPDAGPGFYQRIDEGASLDVASALSLINGYRARNGLGPLVHDAELSEQARQRAATMAANDTSSWGEMPQLSRAAAGASATRVERASAGYRTMAEAFSGWRDSPPHNRVLLEPRGTRIGIAAVDRAGTKYRVYWDIIVTGP